MKIKDLEYLLPVKVKLNKNFTLEDSFDVNTIVLVKAFVLDSNDCGGNCYKAWVSALKEDMVHNRRVAIPDWRNSKTDRYDQTYYESNKPNPDGDYDTTVFVMEEDDCFDLVESNTSNQHTNLSIEFAISMLEELKAIALNRGFNDVAYDNLFYLKIQELKQQLNK